MKYFTKEVKIALTAIVAIVLLFYGINFLKGINIFKQSNTYRVSFDNIAGLTVSNIVYVDGFPIGSVRAIEYDYDHPGHILTTIEIDKQMKLPRGTFAELETEVLGGVKMNLVIPKNKREFLNPGDTFDGRMYNGAMNRVANLLPVVEQILPRLDSIAHALNVLVNDPALQSTLYNARDISENLTTTTEQLNYYLPVLAKKMVHIEDHMEIFSGKLAQLDIEGTMENVNRTLSNVEQITDRVNKQVSGTDNSLGLLLNDRVLYDNLNKTLGSVDSLMLDLRMRPKRYVHFSIFGRKDK